MTAALMPGIAPTTDPIQEQRTISHQCTKQSTEPCHSPFQLFLLSYSPEIERLAMSRSQSSGSAKMPSVSGTRGRPSIRYRLSIVHRRTPVWGSDPTIASMMPTQAMVRPRKGVPPASDDTIEIPTTDSASNCGEPM